MSVIFKVCCCAVNSIVKITNDTPIPNIDPKTCAIEFSIFNALLALPEKRNSLIP
jgi:hypothetical protein